jgi:hypothetical protein
VGCVFRAVLQMLKMWGQTLLFGLLKRVNNSFKNAKKVKHNVDLEAYLTIGLYETVANPLLQKISRHFIFWRASL